MASETQSAPNCPVLFFGTPKISGSFDLLSDAAVKSPSIQARRFVKLDQVPEELSGIEHGVVFLLLAGKNDLLVILNFLVPLKKLIDQGVLRVMVFSMIEHDKIPDLLKAKGCSETLSGKLTQKALGHKLQKSIQIVMASYQTRKKDKLDDLVAIKSNPKSKVGAKGDGQSDDHLDFGLSSGGKGKPASKSGASNEEMAKALSLKGRIEFGKPLDDINDCWLIKTKKDFKFVRGFWMGEMIGPGPSAGTWDECAGPRSRTAESFVWVPRGSPPDPFVPSGGRWVFFGRKPEFIWKTNRWRFVGENPWLYYQADESSTQKIYRFRAPELGVLEIARNSIAAKSKLQAIIQTVTVDKLFKEEKKNEDGSKDLEVEAEKGAGGAWNDGVSRDEEAPPAWGEDLDSEDEEPPEWNDGVDDELDPGTDWGGLDAGRGNKFNSGRGVGQGQGDGKKGYKHEKEVFEKKDLPTTAWKQGAAAFDVIKLEISMAHADGVLISGVTLLERNGDELVLDAPNGVYLVGETLDFEVLLGKEGRVNVMKISGRLLASEPMEQGEREMLQIVVSEKSRFRLGQIQKVFEQRQEQLLNFLKEAKGG